MSASDEWNKRVAEMKAAREKKRSGTAPTQNTSPMAQRTPSPNSQNPTSRRVPINRGGGAPPRGASRRAPPGRADSGPISPSSPGGANAARELNLVKAELKLLQMKYDNEVKKRESLEKQLEAERSKSSSSSSGTTDTPSRNTASTRRSVRQSKAPQINVAEILTKVMAEMKNLEENINRADRQRNRAESELLEVAMLKQTADDALESLVQDMQKKTLIIQQVQENLQSISSSKCASSPDAAKEIEKVCSEIDSLKRDMIRRLDQRSIKSEKQEAFKRASVFVQKIDGNANIPTPPELNIPAAPAPPSLGPTRANQNVRSGPRASTLLTQIRRGHNLNKIDTEAIARERAANRNNCRQSMALLSSLKDTLRTALTIRQEDMNLYGEDDDDWDD